MELHFRPVQTAITAVRKSAVANLEATARVEIDPAVGQFEHRAGRTDEGAAIVARADAGRHAADLAADNPLLVYGVNGIIDIGGKAFIASLKLLVVPLVFFSLACGASNLSDGSSIGRIGMKTIGLYLLTTAIAITLGLSVANVVNPGMGLSLVTETTFVAKESPPLKEVIIALVPTNPVKAMAEGNMLQVIVFAILLGVAIAKCGSAGEKFHMIYYRGKVRF